MDRITPNDAPDAWAACRRLLADYTVVVDDRVSWGEMDAFGHVNNSVYFQYFESARMAYFERLGFLDVIGSDGIGPILAETRCRFRSALRYPDLICIGARVARIDADRFLMEYAVASAATNRIAAEGDGLVVTFDYGARRKATLPPGIASAIREQENGRDAL